MSKHIVHWDDVATETHEEGGIRSRWTDLGGAAGSKGVGVNRIEVLPGARSTPLHAEGSEEEIFFVLGGAGRSWQSDGETEEVYEIRPGDCLVHRAGDRAHSLVAGPDGLDVLAFGMRSRSEATWFPRIAALRVGPAVLDVDGRHQWVLEAALGDPDLPAPSARPGTIVNVDEVEPESDERGDVAYEWRGLAGPAGSERTGLNHETAPPGKLNCPPHCHSAEEEIFVVVAGEGMCVLGSEEYPVRPGHVIARPPGTRVAHAFRGGGVDGVTILSYGTRDTNDIAYYPRSGKVYFRGVGLMTRVESLDYWDGE